MPEYDYKCIECGRIVTIKHKINDTCNRACRKCYGIMKRIISGGTGFILRGSGWTEKGIKNEK